MLGSVMPTPKTFQEAEVRHLVFGRTIPLIICFISPSMTVLPNWNSLQSSNPPSVSTSGQPMPFSISHALLRPPPPSRHSARKTHQRLSSGPKKSKRPARLLAHTSAAFRRQSTPSARVSCANCLGDRYSSRADHQAYVLRKSSTINNIRYPRWNEPVPPPSTGARYSYVSRS